MLYRILRYDVFIESFFFFKQKTAYEMRISDWSSDVCSSDLRTARWCPPSALRSSGSQHRPPSPHGECSAGHGCCGQGDRWPSPSARRSEEHTSELQSLMRISYAVFCLKKNKNNTHQQISHTTLHYKYYHKTSPSTTHHK